MSVTARVLCDSINPTGNRLTTFVIEYPRFILAEVNTHRMLSRSTASSRAIPVKKRIQAIRDNPVLPSVWGLDQPGMQAETEADEDLAEKAKQIWLNASEDAIRAAQALMDLGIHKQVANRLLEPFVHVSTIVAATEWANFFALRWHPKAQPEFYALSEVMKEAFLKSEPEYLEWGEWHLPYITDEEKALWADPQILAKWSTARSARVSYNNHDGTKPNSDKDLQLHQRLLGEVPVHASPAEMPAYACANRVCNHGNYKGFHQYRKTIKNENITEFPWNAKLEAYS